MKSAYGGLPAVRRRRNNAGSEILRLSRRVNNMAKSTPSFEFTDGIFQETTRFSKYWEKLRPYNFICFVVYATKGFMLYRMILMVVLLFAFHVNTGWTEAGPKLTPLPGRITIGGTTYEIVSRTSIPGERTSRLPTAYRFPKGQPITTIFPCATVNRLFKL